MQVTNTGDKAIESQGLHVQSSARNTNNGCMQQKVQLLITLCYNIALFISTLLAIGLALIFVTQKNVSNLH